jgi:hypothetical protein
MGKKPVPKIFIHFANYLLAFQKTCSKAFETSPEAGACRACNQYHLAAEQ